MYMKRFSFFALLFFCSLSATAQPLQAVVEKQLQHPVLNGAWWGGLAVYTDHPEQTLFALQADQRLTPASTLKLLTTAAALETLGPHYRFQTRLYASAQPDEKGILKGDLYLQGGGDPTLGSTRVPGAQDWRQVASQWAKAVKKVGIRRVEGSLYADVSAFEGPSIAPKVNWENIGNYYAAPVSPVCFHDNLFKIFFSPQPFDAKRAEVTRTEPKIPQLHLSSFVTTDAKNKRDNAYVYGAPKQYEMEIYGTIPTNLTGFSIQAAMPDPALFAMQALHNALREEGIAVGGRPQTTDQAPDYAQMKLLHTYSSPELKDIILIVNKRSFNLYAEMLLRQLALHAGKKGSVQNGLTELEKFLRQNKLAAPQDAVLYDGSGLSRDNMLTPRVLVNTLAFMTKSPNFSYYYQSLATPDDRGDLLLLRYFLKPKHQVQDVRVKGGTIDGVKTVAGYVYDESGRPIAFALMANNLASKDETILRIHENIIKQLLQVKP
ncbi:D-alanyl-D-alanine carboxypeptidase/D-alanyl-D-alanine-endopeptidase [Candidatus Avelusimicrobium gallicola]|uniref:D-alanyl-D-alanine carboxypeptidase/D-alanyl-D-alanine-endopeptidase n=2 Tax=Candidatus Avelusimicrobium gallicola TaxID=2562704 RepID=A0A1Y4DJN8_9BACT|nr:D-alanyl-D-alanine carboxypeptidase/D-alanyl-D-alanine-endopeptidase [Elusimicrobium sp. An273]